MSYPMTKPDWWGDEPFTLDGARAALRRLAAPYDGNDAILTKAQKAYEDQMQDLDAPAHWKVLAPFLRDAWVCEVTGATLTSGREADR